ncbi:MAG: hypothetical protein E7409_02530 [Ruminococcaceae bacterium]|nr:hypothetical protein [Oscillospiraceae bacterium]
MNNTIKQLDEHVLGNIVRAQITRECEGGESYVFETASEAGITPYMSEGEEKIHRVKNQILGSIRTEDIVLGYDIKLVNNTFSPELLALVDGGVVTKDEADNFVKYEAPEAGVALERENLTVTLYAQEVDCDGGALGYYKFSFLHAKGKPVEYSLKDGEFYIPEMTLRSRAKRGERPVTVELLDELPALS